jgi:hypothetical protein
MNLLIAIFVFVLLLYLLNNDSFRVDESENKWVRMEDTVDRIGGYIALFCLFWYILYGVLELALGL